VMLTTHDTPCHRLAAAKAGAAGYVAKRDMETQLEATVEGLLRSRRSGGSCS
jgi:DNA-binding NarL/FixJ family response regulator